MATIRLLQIFNQYRSLVNGEENVVRRTAELVERHGGECRLFLRSSRELSGWCGRVHAFWSGFYNPFAAQQLRATLREFRPDIVHAHNLLPLISPSVLVACYRAGLPVVFTAHNQALTCPRADHLRHGELCDRCLGGHEYYCVLYNCRENMCESIAYAMRSAVARLLRFYHKYVHVIIALTHFARSRLLQQGFAEEQVVVLHNMAPVAAEPVHAPSGQYVLFAGRLSQEKGLVTLLEVAKVLSDIPFVLAGGGPLAEQLRGASPGNVKLLGQVSAQELAVWYRGARLLVLPSLTYEMCPLVIGEAMGHGLPVVASRIGGIPELVRDGQTGILCTPGSVTDFVRGIRQLWDRPQLCAQMGEEGWRWARQEFDETVYWDRLMSIYAYAAERAGRRWARPWQRTPIEEQCTI